MRIQNQKWLVGVCAVALSIGCNIGTQTDAPDAETIEKAKDSGEKTTDISDVSVPGTLEISSGAAVGTKLDFQANSFPAGTKVSVKATAKPDEFSIIDDELSASAPIEIKATADGSELSAASNPMTLAIPITPSSTALSLVDKVESNLCVTLKSVSGLFVWRFSDLTVDSAAKKISLKTLYLGVFQASYCGTTELPGFSAAIAAGAGVSTEGKLSFSLDSASYFPSNSNLCLVLIEDEKDKSEDMKSKVIAVANVQSSKGAESISLGYDRSVLSADKIYHIAIAGQGGEGICSSSATVDELFKSFNHLFAFQKDFTSLDVEGLSMVLGESEAEFSQEVLHIGVPEGSRISQADPIAKQLCVSFDSEGGISEYNLAIDDSGLIAGNTSVELLAPKDFTRFTAVVGSDCDMSELGWDFAQSPSKYVVELEKLILPSEIYLVAVNMTLDTPQGGDTDACLAMYQASTVDSEGNPLKGTLSDISSLSRMTVTTGQTYPLYIPWHTATTDSDGTPTFDVRLDFSNPNCESDGGSTSLLPAVGLLDRPLNPTFGN